MIRTVKELEEFRAKIENSPAGELFWKTKNALVSELGEDSPQVQVMLRLEMAYWIYIRDEFGRLAEEMQKVTA